MQNPEFDVRKVSLANEDKLFLGLATPFLNDSSSLADVYRPSQVIPCGGETAYAIYEKDYSVLPIKFFSNDECLAFDGDEPVQFMTLDEVRLIKELGEIVIDGTHCSIENIKLHIVHEAGRIQHIIIFNLKTIN